MSMWGSAWLRLPPIVATARTAWIGDTAQRTAQQRPFLAHGRMTLDVREPRDPSDHQFAFAVDSDLCVLLADLLQTHQPGRMQNASLHHQHHGGRATNRPYIGIFGIQQRKRLLQRVRQQIFERRHDRTSAHSSSRLAATFSGTSSGVRWRAPPKIVKREPTIASCIACAIATGAA